MARADRPGTAPPSDMTSHEAAQDSSFKTDSQIRRKKRRARHNSVLPNGLYRSYYSSSLEQPPAKERELYRPGEISDAAEFREFLQQHLDSPEIIIRDLFQSTNHDLVQRFQVCFEFIKQHDFHTMFEKSLKHDRRLRIISTETGYEALLSSAMSHDSLSIVRYLLREEGPELIMRPSVNQPYAGTTALHLAILNGDRDLLQDMLDMLDDTQRSQLLHTEATGDFYDGSKGISGQPLALALACGHVDLFFDLVEHGGNIGLRDKMGNSPLHALVYYGAKDAQAAFEMLKSILTSESCRAWYRKAFPREVVGVDPIDTVLAKDHLVKLVNKERFSLLTLSAKLGVYPILEYLMNTEGVYKYTMWKVGTITSSYYDMSEIDPSVIYLDNPGKPSVLELLLYAHHEEKLPILNVEPIRSLMESKWKMHRAAYYAWAAWHLFVICFSAALATGAQNLVCTAPPNINNTLTTEAPGAMVCEGSSVYDVGVWLVTYISGQYLIICLIDYYNIIYWLIQGRLRWPHSRHYRTPWSLVFRLDEFDLIMLLYLTCNLLWLSCRHGGYACTVIPRAMAHVFGWYFLLFFTRTIRTTSYFTHMVDRIIGTDFIRFGLVALVLSLGFGVGLKVLFSASAPKEFDTIDASLTTMALLLLGLGNIDYTEDQPYFTLSRFISIIYILLTTVLLLNIAIGAITDTYTSITANRETLFHRMRIRAVLVIERRFSWLFLRRRLKKVLNYEPVPAKWYLEVRHEILDSTY